MIKVKVIKEVGRYSSVSLAGYHDTDDDDRETRATKSRVVGESDAADPSMKKYLKKRPYMEPDGLQENEDDIDQVSKVVIYNKNGKILILKRADGENDWDLPGGHLKKNEDAKDGAIRETFEETSLNISNPKHVHADENVNFYKCPCPKGDINLDPKEHIDFQWINPREVNNYSIRHSLKDAILNAINVFQEDFQKTVKQGHKKMKIKLIGKGGNTYNIGGKMKKPSYARSKSAPPGFGGSLEEKKKKDDRCTRIAKRKYDVWPSAYASGAVVRCRQGKIWKGISEVLTEEEFVPHMMYNPKTGEKKMSKKHEDHVELAKKGYTHVDPEELEKILRDEGGAAGLEPLVKGTKASKKEVKITLKLMPNVGKHADGDYILSDDEEVKIVKEKKKKAGTESSKESSLKDWFGRKGAKGKTGGWVDCNAPDGKGGYKSCGRQEGEKRKKYPACRPTPAACKEKGKGKSWGKKAKKQKK